MKDTLLHDLALWERGELDTRDLVKRHPEREVGEALSIHLRLLSAAHNELPDPRLSWPAVRDRLTARRPPLLVKFGLWLRRPLVAGAASVLVGGAAVAATVEPVRDGLGAAVRGVASLFDGERRADGDGEQGAGKGTGDRRSGPGRGDTGRNGRPDVAGAGKAASGKPAGKGDDRGRHKGHRKATPSSRGGGRGHSPRRDDKGSGSPGGPGGSDKGDGRPSGGPGGSGGNDGGAGGPSGGPGNDDGDDDQGDGDGNDDQGEDADDQGEDGDGHGGSSGSGRGSSGSGHGNSKN
jgi:hypothetical protein